MKNLYAILCLTFAVLLFSEGESFALSPCQGDDETKWQNCEGILTSSSGKEYVGVFNNGIFDGEHVAEGIKYVGEFKDNIPHGQGTYTFADGRKYVGELKDGKYHGQGTFTWADGRKYVGEWKELPNGQGTYTYADGGTYVGEWKDGKYHGQGTKTYSDGGTYVGEWKDGNWHGQGTETWADGRKYVGELKDNKYHGQGTYTFVDGRIWEGTFDNGEWVSGDKYDDIQSYKKTKTKSLEESNDNIRLALDILNYTLMGDKKSRDGVIAKSSEGCTFSVNVFFLGQVLDEKQTLYVDNIIPDTVKFYSKQVYNDFLQQYQETYYVEFRGDDPVLDNSSSGSMVLHVDADLERVRKAWGLLFSQACEGSSPSEF
jgi:hypothetical protein